MAFDKPTRNRLQRFVGEARDLLLEEFTHQLQADYGMDPKTGTVTAMERLGHLDDTKRDTARILREILAHYQATEAQPAAKAQQSAVKRIAHEQAFTVLNRLAALRMMEARGLLLESVSKDYQSQAFQLFSNVAGNAVGDTGDTYRHFLFSLFDEFTRELNVLFDRHSPFGRLFPDEPSLLKLLELIDDDEIAPLWEEDETIGWIYQYYNDPDERKKMRKASAAPRNSRELAVRNQFFTPRYVVEFLTDNTLGRIWYEMTKGETSLKDLCRYLVRRPTEIFLDEGQDAPVRQDTDENISQEELLKQPVYIPHRPVKDPREIRLLDPACGSMHFGLYAFDLYEVIYEEAWGTGICLALQDAYSSKDDYLHDVPRLIIEHNIHGVDIDPRAVQIAGLSLWLRAQRSWKNTPATVRPQIRRSNVVCAEPMPGGQAMLDDFVATLDPPLLGELVKSIFDKMKLAGEAGTLLKIEEEIRAAVDDARAAWAGLKGKSYELFSINEYDRVADQAKLSNLDTALRAPGSPLSGDFFDTAEDSIYAALRDYAESAEAGDYQRRLFAEDTAHGFAFIDISQKEYDASVMNPPFGSPTASTQDYVADNYPDSKHDVAAAFVERWVTHSPNGYLGAITTRNLYYLPTSADWRRIIGGRHASFDCFADLGFGVLDAAMVEAASIVIRSSQSESPILFFAHKNTENKEEGVQRDIEHINETRELSENTFAATFASIQYLETGSFCYWVPDSVRTLFGSNPSMVDCGFDCRAGLQSNDDFRWLRLWWEAPKTQSSQAEWKPYAKGGDFSQYYSDLPLVINWANRGRQMRPFIEGRGDSASRYIRSEQMYFREGLTWSQRSQVGLGTRAYPAGAVFGIKGPVLFAPDRHDLLPALSLTNSSTFKGLIALHMSFGSYDTGTIQRNPTPLDLTGSRDSLGDLANKQFSLVLSVHRRDETNHFFSVPRVSEQTLLKWLKHDERDRHKIESQFEEQQTKIDRYVAEAYGLDTDSQRRLLRQDGNSDGVIQTFCTEEFAVRPGEMVSWMTGTVYGRWDIRYATGERKPRELPDPFDPLPACPPGMLQNADGLPAAPADVPHDYPLRITWPGILVDDDGHPEDIVARVRDALTVVWDDCAPAIEQEACETLGVRTLRDYFAEKKSGGKFFKDHLKRYSKSRRKAPIYWPLSTSSGSYTLWVYYHRLNSQTLFSCVNDFVEPKLESVESAIRTLHGDLSRSRAEEKELEKRTDLASELIDFRDTLLCIAKDYKPNLNDGVQISAAPLWSLFRLKSWQKVLKQTWDNLEGREYDWARLATAYWPDSVVRTAHKDRSIAIAHGIEDELWREVEVKGHKETPKREWQPRDLSEERLDEIAERFK